jgi:hypothetical protein
MPGGDMLLVADYVRERSDFILVGPEGQIVIVDNYFSMANPRTLTTAGGARTTGDLVQNWPAPLHPVNTLNQPTSKMSPSVKSRRSMARVKSFARTAHQKSWKPVYLFIKAIRWSPRTVPPLA